MQPLSDALGSVPPTASDSSTARPASPILQPQQRPPPSASAPSPINPPSAVAAVAPSTASRAAVSPFLALSPSELRTFSASLLRRLHEAPYPDVCGDLHLLRDVLSACLSQPQHRNTQLFLQPNLYPLLVACLSRHALPISAECDAIQDVCQLALSLTVQHLQLAVGGDADAGKGVAGCVAMHEFPPACFAVPEPPAVAAASIPGVPAGFSFGGYSGTAWTANGATSVLASAVPAAGVTVTAASSSDATTIPQSSAFQPAASSDAASQSLAAASSSSTAEPHKSSSHTPASLTPTASTTSTAPTDPSFATAPDAVQPSTEASPSAPPQPLMDATSAANAASALQPAVVVTSSQSNPSSAPSSAPPSPPRAALTTASTSGLSTPSSSSSTPSLALSRALTPSTSLLHAKTAAPLCAYTTFLPTLQALHPISPQRQPSPDYAAHLDIPLMDCLDLLLSSEHEYYRQCTPEFPCPRAANDVELTGAYCEWRDALQPGEWVDVYLRGRWRCGQLSATPVDEQHVEVAFEGPSAFDNIWAGRRELVERHSNLFAPPYSKTRPALHPSQQWRFELGPHLQLDALDTVQKWWDTRTHSHSTPQRHVPLWFLLTLVSSCMPSIPAVLRQVYCARAGGARRPRAHRVRRLDVQVR